MRSDPRLRSSAEIRMISQDNGRRLLLRMRVDLYGTYCGKHSYRALRRSAVVLSCKDAKQAEAALVSIMELIMHLDGMELDNPLLVMERL